ncbi:MAG: VPLPA-CTERM sorting domain-containing protein [Pseudomonadota bacterium]
MPEPFPINTRKETQVAVMKKLFFLAVFAAATLAAAPPAQAITFNFFWSSDPALDANLLFSADPTITVTGTMDINVAPGMMFGLADIANVNLSVAGPNITGFTLSEWTSAAGTVASDGLSASFVGSGSNEPFALTPTNAFFGCTSDVCDGSAISEISILEPGFTGLFRFDYTSANSALASMQMTAVQPPAPIPLPAALPFLLAGLGALGLMRRTRRQK